MTFADVFAKEKRVLTPKSPKLNTLQGIHNHIVKSFEFLLAQETKLMNSHGKHKQKIESSGIEWDVKTDDESKLLYREQFMLLQLLLLMTQKQIEYCYVYQKFIIELAMDIYAQADVDAQIDVPQFTSSIQARFSNQHKSIVQELDSTMNDTEKMLLTIKTSLQALIVQKLTYYQIYCTNVNMKRKSVYQKLEKIKEEESKHRKQDSTPDPNSPLQYINQHNLEWELLQLQQQVTDKELTILNLKIDVISDDLVSIGSLIVNQQQQQSVSIRPIDDFLIMLKPNAHMIYKSLEEYESRWDAEMQQNEIFFTLSTMLQKIRVQKYFLSERNLKQFNCTLNEIVV